MSRSTSQWLLGFALGSTGTVVVLALLFSLLDGATRAPQSVQEVSGRWQKEWAPRPWTEPPRRTQARGL